MAQRAIIVAECVTDESHDRRQLTIIIIVLSLAPSQSPSTSVPKWFTSDQRLRVGRRRDPAVCGIQTDEVVEPTPASIDSANNGYDMVAYQN